MKIISSIFFALSLLYLVIMPRDSEAACTGSSPTWTVTDSGDPLVNGDAFQTCLTNAVCGDTIVLQAGASYQTRVAFVNSGGPQGSPFSLPNKSCGANQYVTVQTSLVSSLPSGRISPGHAGLMAQLATNTNSWVIEPASNAGNYRFIGIDFTNTSSLKTYTGNTVAIVYATPQSPAYGAWGHDMIFDRVWIHPYDDDDDPANTTRTAQFGIVLDGANHTIKNSDIRGFCCFAYNTPTQKQQSTAVVIGLGPGPVTLENNFLEGYDWNIFTGGSSAKSPGNALVNPANTATITGATLTQATFSQTATLVVGDYVAFVVPQWTTLVNCGGLTGGGGNASDAYVVQVDSINSGTGLVTYHGVGCDSINDGPSLPANGTLAQWRGTSIVGVTVTRNTISKRTKWCDGTWTAPKSVWEMIDGSDVLFEGNIVTVPPTFAGSPGGCAPTNTAFTANQDGTQPCVANNNNVFRNNIFRGLGRIVHAQPYPNHSAVPPTGTFIFTNNLLDGTARSGWFETETAAGVSSWTVIHNTVRGNTNSIFFDLQNGQMNVSNMTFRDNIVTSGTYFFNPNTSYPGKIEDHNVIINNSGGAPPAYTSGDFVVANDAAVGFVDVTAADAGGDYHGYALAAGSAYKNAASDGTDPGVNFATLDAALASRRPVGASRPAVADRPIAPDRPAAPGRPADGYN